MKFSALFVLLMLAGCSSGITKPSAPKDLVEHDSMVVVLRELVVLEAHVETRYQQVQTYYKLMDASGRACLKKYHISPDRFSRSYDYYTAHQEKLQRIYTQVMDSLTKEVNVLNAKGLELPDTIDARVKQDVTDPFPNR